uniref:Uncharacterized protein n=1 Tax=Anguilla anguilla TaxID=7936 RepID=A0A0E9QQC6_ANGAN
MMKGCYWHTEMVKGEIFWPEFSTGSRFHLTISLAQSSHHFFPSSKAALRILGTWRIVSETRVPRVRQSPAQAVA